MIKDEEILELWTANQDIIAFSRTLIELARSEKEERNFCPRCGKRLAGLSFLPNAVSIHTCMAPQRRRTSVYRTELYATMNVVIVCGGRHYSNQKYVFAQLDRIHAEEPITRLAHGGATGADTLADAWAKSRGIPVQPYPVSKAEWDSLGPKAGPIRNRKMLMNERPQKVVAFPGNKGTADMIRIAEQDCVEIIDLRKEP